MSHCIDVTGRKHIRICKPAFSGSLWHNYKGFFSMVLLATCDAQYCFSFIDVGKYGSTNDTRILKNSKMRKMFDKNKMNTPESKVIPGDDLELTYF